MDIFDLTVADIMQEDVVTVAPDHTVAELLELLEREGISGTPVVGSDGTVEGVVSLSDVARAAAEEASGGDGESREEGDDRSAFFRSPGVPLSRLPGSLPKTKLGTLAVRDIMTGATFSVRPEASLVELARFLEGAGVHRALVLDGAALAGLVSSMDVVRAVARADAGWEGGRGNV